MGKVPFLFPIYFIGRDVIGREFHNFYLFFFCFTRGLGDHLISMRQSFCRRTKREKKRKKRLGPCGREEKRKHRWIHYLWRLLLSNSNIVRLEPLKLEISIPGFVVKTETFFMDLLLYLSGYNVLKMLSRLIIIFPFDMSRVEGDAF